MKKDYPQYSGVDREGCTPKMSSHQTTVAAIDAFSELLMRPKCICGWGSAPNPAGELASLSRPPSWWKGAHSPPGSLRPRISDLRSAPPRPVII